MDSPVIAGIATFHLTCSEGNGKSFGGSCDPTENRSYPDGASASTGRERGATVRDSKSSIRRTDSTENRCRIHGASENAGKRSRVEVAVIQGSGRAESEFAATCLDNADDDVFTASDLVHITGSNTATAENTAAFHSGTDAATAVI